jgi:hypothetical protein
MAHFNPERRSAMAKPKRVETEVFADNRERLSAMGRAGAKATNEKKRKEQEERDIVEDIARRQREEAEADARQMAEDRGDDLIPEDDR